MIQIILTKHKKYNKNAEKRRAILWKIPLLPLRDSMRAEA